jgi:hypothetical protein
MASRSASELASESASASGLESELASGLESGLESASESELELESGSVSVLVLVWAPALRTLAYLKEAVLVRELEVA